MKRYLLRSKFFSDEILHSTEPCLQVLEERGKRCTWATDCSTCLTTFCRASTPRSPFFLFLCWFRQILVFKLLFCACVTKKNHPCVSGFDKQGVVLSFLFNFKECKWVWSGKNKSCRENDMKKWSLWTQHKITPAACPECGYQLCERHFFEALLKHCI